MKKTIFVVALLALLLSYGALNVQASPLTLMLESGSNVITVVDGGTNDKDGITDGLISYTGIVGSVDLNIVTGLSQPLIGSADLAELHLNSVNVNFSGPGSIKLTLIDDDFSFPQLSPGIMLTAVGGVGGAFSAPIGSTASFQSWVNTANLTAIPPSSSGSSIQVLNYGPVTLLVYPFEAFSAMSAGSFAYSGLPFSLFTTAEINFTGPGSISFDSIVSVPTPEPASLVLLGTGLLGVAAVVRRRQKQAAKDVA